MSLESGTNLGPYRVETLIGQGGMGEVYRALDTRLGRLIALKVLPNSVAADRERGERFDREARAIASLSHPNICALFDVGTSGNVSYLIMEYLEGETLADRLRSGRLPVAEALRLGAQIAEALAAAHARRIVHRDLKPANIKLTPNGVKVLDFGLAKFLDPEAPGNADADTRMATREQTILGTASYMSPEQARGAFIDHRTDNWAFGVVLYEMLAGRRLFEGGSTPEILAAVLNATIDLSALPSEVPPRVRDLLGRLLHRDALERLGDISAAASLLASESRGQTGSDGASAVSIPAAAAGPVSIIVLPFVNSSPDPENEYFSDGLTEEVIADLSKVRALRVISRTTAMQLKGTTRGLADVARELDVRYALEGSVRKMGDRLRITAQLVDTRTDASLWSDKYSGTLEDVFEIQERVSRAIVAALKVRLNESEDRGLVAATHHNAYAYDTYLRARRDIWSFVPERMERAEKELRHALSVVGDDPFLYSGLGTVNWQYVNSGISGDRRYLEEATRCAERVIELAPDSAHGPSLLGLIAAQRGDLPGWVRHLKRAVEIDPHDPYSVVWLGIGWMFAGRPDHARPLFERLSKTDPYLDYLNFGLTFDAYSSGEFERAVAICEQARHLSPDHPIGVMFLVQVYGSMGDLERMKRTAEEYLPDPASHPLATLTHILKHALLGEAEAADALVSAGWAEKIWGDFQYTHTMAQAQAVLGRADEAMRWLTHATERGFIHYPFFSRVDPLLENLRGDPRFVRLMEVVRRKWEGFEAVVNAG